MIGAASYTLGVLISTGSLRQWNIFDFGKSIIIGGISGAVTAGIGNLFEGSGIFANLKDVSKAFLQAGFHGVSQGFFSMVGSENGSGFFQGFLSGALGSLSASGWTAAIGKETASTLGGMIAFGAISGGIGAELTGGNFFKGFVQGGMVAALNHGLQHLGGYQALSKKKYAEYILGKSNLTGAEHNSLGYMFEKLFLEWAKLNIGFGVSPNTTNYYGTVPDGTSPLMYDNKLVRDGVFYEVKCTSYNIGKSMAQVAREVNAVSLNNASKFVPVGALVIASPGNVYLTKPLINYAAQRNIDLVHFKAFYKMNNGVMQVKFMTTSPLNLFNTAIRLGGFPVNVKK